MSDKKQAENVETSEVAIAKAKDFWTKNSKIILGVGTLLVLLVGGFYVYQHFFKNPKEEKAADAMFKAEDYYRQDSVNLALNGDGQNLGFLKIIDKYSGTAAANLAEFYAGSCYIKLDDNVNAVKHLKSFSTDAKEIQQRAYKLLGDAYADQGKNNEALDAYKKAANAFKENETGSADALYLAAYLAEKVLKNQKEAIDLFKELKEKYPRTHGYQADNHLAQLGVYNAN